MGRSPSEEGIDYAKRSPVRRRRRHRRVASPSPSPTANSPVSSSCSSSNDNHVSSSASKSVSYPRHSVNSSPYHSSLPSNSVTPIEEYYVPVAPLPIFNGDVDECPFMHLSRFDHVCRANNAFSPSIAARIFPASLDSYAILWYEIFIDPSMSWEEIRSAFLQSFRSPGSEARSELFSVHQSDKEMVIHYYLRMQLILKRWPEHELSDEILKSIFIDGLREELKEWVSPQRPITLNEDFKLATSWERAEGIREARKKAMKKEIKCGFCGIEGHEEEVCEVRKRMRELWGISNSKIKESFARRRGVEGEEEGSMTRRFQKLGSLNRQCRCLKHQCSKKAEENNSVKSVQEEFHEVEEG